MCHICHNIDYNTAFDSDPLGVDLTPQYIDAATLQQQAMTSMNGASWNTSNSAGQNAAGDTVLTYSYDGSWGSGGTGSQGGAISRVHDGHQDILKGMFDEYSSVANLSFTERNDGQDGDIAIRMENMSHTGVGGYAYLPGRGVGGNVTLDTEFGAAGSRTQSGLYADLHELGHALGLHHPFAQTQTGAFAAKAGGLSGNYMSAEYSVMAYQSGTNVKRGDVTGLQILDIYVLHQKYGANVEYKSGDDDWVMGSEKFVQALWDGNGNDTIKVADGVGSSVIDLRDGDFLNEIGNAQFRIAYDAQIENAHGGQGDDNIRGNGLENELMGGRGADEIHGDAGDDIIYGGKLEMNAAGDIISVVDEQDGADLLFGGTGADIILGNAGNDTIVAGDSYEGTEDLDANVLYGGLGDDEIYGGAGDDVIAGNAGLDHLRGNAGDDVYVFGEGAGLDLIYGFEGAGQAGGDLIRILVNSQVTDFDSLMANTYDDGEDTEFNLADGHSLIVDGYTKDQFTIDDFDFVTNAEEDLF